VVISLFYGKKGRKQYKPKPRLRRWRVIATGSSIVSAHNEPEAIEKTMREEIEDFSYSAVPLDYLEMIPEVAYSLSRMADSPKEFFTASEIKKARALDIVDVARRDDFIIMYWRERSS